MLTENSNHREILKEVLENLIKKLEENPGEYEVLEQIRPLKEHLSTLELDDVQF